MRLLIKTLGWLLTLAALAATGLAVFVVLDGHPLVPEERTLTAAERAWAKGWLRAANPRGMKDGERATLSLSEPEANVLAALLIARLGQGRVAVRIEDNRARAAASLRLPLESRARFLNLEIDLVGTSRLPRIEGVRLAGLPLPAGLLQTLAERMVGTLDQSHLLQHVDFEPGQMHLTYEWHQDAVDTLGSGLVSADERARLLHYQDALAEYGNGRGRSERFQLAALLSHLLVEAGHRGPGADPVQENRAAILALAAYVNRHVIRPPADASGQVGDAPAPIQRFHPVLLRGRRDLARHFMTSAALVTQGGSALSDLAGFYKEILDSDGGSGFSFADLGADRAGTRFAGVATGNREGALAAQSFARQGLSEDDFMPAIDGLPEGLSKDAFATAFQDNTSPAYQRVLAHIDGRIDSGAFYRPVTR